MAPRGTKTEEDHEKDGRTGSKEAWRREEWSGRQWRLKSYRRAKEDGEA